MLGVQIQEFISYLHPRGREVEGMAEGRAGPMGEPRGCRGEADVPRGQGAEG